MKIKDKSMAGILILIILAVLCLYYFYRSHPGYPPTQINENIGFNKSTETIFIASNG